MGYYIWRRLSCQSNPVVSQECAGQENKNLKLLELIVLRGNKYMTRFCDCLQLSGHIYLGEMIREEGNHSDHI